MPEQSTPQCSHCGDRGEIYSIYNPGESLCGLCYRNRYAHCVSCGAEINRQDDTYFNNGVILYCTTCYGDRAAPCRNCGDRTPLFHLVRCPNDYRWCEDCYDGNFSECDECEETFDNLNLTDGYCSR